MVVVGEDGKQWYKRVKVENLERQGNAAVVASRKATGVGNIGRS